MIFLAKTGKTTPQPKATTPKQPKPGAKTPPQGEANEPSNCYTDRGDRCS